MPVNTQAYIYLPWEIEFNAVYLKRGFSAFEQHTPFLRFLIDYKYPVKVNWIRQWLNFGLHPDDRIDPANSRGNRFVHESHEEREGDSNIPDGISSVFWAQLVASEVSKEEGGHKESGGITLDELKLRYPELSARAELEAAASLQ